MEYQGDQPVHPAHADVQAGQQQYHLHDAARTLMLLGAAAAVSAVFGCSSADADAWQVFIAAIGFLAWLLGVCLLSLMTLLPGPQADRFAGVAIASAGAGLNRVFMPWN